jgi:hypothetical protein
MEYTINLWQYMRIYYSTTLIHFHQDPWNGKMTDASAYIKYRTCSGTLEIEGRFWGKQYIQEQ